MASDHDAERHRNTARRVCKVGGGLVGRQEFKHGYAVIVPTVEKVSTYSINEVDTKEGNTDCTPALLSGLPVQIIFHDAPAYFSDEEWKLLHDWQKELYRNVMKEIHQALISLGPLITTTISSLRAKEKQEQCSSSPKDMNARYIIPDSPTGGEFTNPDEARFKGEEALDLNYSHDTEGRHRNVCQSKEMAIFKVKRRKERVILIDDLEQEVEERGTNRTLDYSAVNSMFLPRLGSDEEAHIKKEDIGRSITCTDVDSNFSPGLRNSDEVCLIESPLQRSEEIVSVLIKKEDETSSIDLSGSERMEDIGSKTGNESMGRAKEDGDSLCYSEKSPRSTLFGKIRSKDTQNSDMETDFRIEGWSQRGEKTTRHENSFARPDHLSAYLECESNQRISQFSSYLPKPYSHQTIYTFTECEERGGTMDELGGHAKTHSRERIHACTECEKSFFEKSHLIAHHKTHSGERTYPCTLCSKSFNRKYNLHVHMRKHTGEKPYKCTDCNKEFIWRSGFNQHQKMHTGMWTVQQ